MIFCRFPWPACQNISSAIFEENSPFKEEQPIVQCVQIKLLPSKGLDQPDRYRLIFSDIDNFIQSMLATCMFPGCSLRN